ncbi:hypothetical protein CABS01_11531 [Colletotrichum abscissum]|uniref:Uncharacterized protein n=1 Tax=Colletotrichum abscissum TaxID=1671311 RepID=A0A9P9XKM5_9PEZI|nr:uncharacterized protein CABS01_11531 [Colletotrichum abscissum]KAI3555058.1 hypothetical protein CABS02_04897 [Colletotrichum abscissum]KAK1493362.1 hypothetical protein CABS01_11531 [Colletotrichum abscissum]
MFWLSHTFTDPWGITESTVLRWQERCVIGEKVELLRQASLFFLDEDADFLRLANYETDEAFDYVAHAAVDLIRGFHHASLQKDYISKKGAREWSDISKSAAILLLRHGIQKASEQNADLIQFLSKLDRLPEASASRIQHVFRAWDPYGRKCPARVLRQRLSESFSWNAPQKDSPMYCVAENQLLMTCPATELILGKSREIFVVKDYECATMRVIREFLSRLWDWFTF